MKAESVDPHFVMFTRGNKVIFDSHLVKKKMFKLASDMKYLKQEIVTYLHVLTQDPQTSMIKFYFVNETKTLKAEKDKMKYCNFQDTSLIEIVILFVKPRA